MNKQEVVEKAIAQMRRVMKNEGYTDLPKVITNYFEDPFAYFLEVALYKSFDLAINSQRFSHVMPKLMRDNIFELLEDDRLTEILCSNRLMLNKSQRNINLSVELERVLEGIEAIEETMIAAHKELQEYTLTLNKIRTEAKLYAKILETFLPEHAPALVDIVNNKLLIRTSPPRNAGSPPGLGFKFDIADDASINRGKKQVTAENFTDLVKQRLAELEQKDARSNEQER